MNRVLYSLLVLVLMVVPLSGDAWGRVGSAWWDFLHAPGFLLIAATVLRLAGAPGRFPKPSVILAVCLAVPAIEAVQIVTGREASLTDMLYGWSGCAAAVMLCLRIPGRKAWATLILLLAAVWPGLITLDHVRMQRAFPVLADFAGNVELTRWDLEGLEVIPGEGLMVVLGSDEPYPGLFLNDLVSDWSGTTGLSLELSVLGDPGLSGWVRIDDKPGDPSYHDRFQLQVRLEAGFNRITIPASAFALTSGGRPMNLGSVATMGLFFDPGQGGRTVTLHRVALEYGSETPEM